MRNIECAVHCPYDPALFGVEREGLGFRRQAFRLPSMDWAMGGLESENGSGSMGFGVLGIGVWFPIGLGSMLLVPFWILASLVLLVLVSRRGVSLVVGHLVLCIHVGICTSSEKTCA